MKIAIVAPPWVPVPPPSYGGIETMLDTLARGLKNSGHEVTLFASGDSTCPVDIRSTLPSVEGVDIGDLVVEIDHSLNSYDQISEMGFDIVHDHTLAGPIAGVGKVNCPIVTTNHGPFVSKTMGVWKGFTKRSIPIIAISESQANFADPEVEISKVIHHGIDASRVPVGTGQGGFFASLGRMSPDKGIHIVAELAQLNGWPLKIGAKMREKSEYEYFENMVKPWLGGEVEYLGELNSKEKFELLGDSYALINPIQWAEPFGLVMIESLACGTPVIVTPCGAAPEIVTNGLTGFLCDTKENIVEAVNDISAINRHTSRWEVESRFSMKAMVENHIAFYREQIINRSNRETIDLLQSSTVLS